MPWCPKCRIEYVKGIEMCSDCHCTLVDEYPPEKANEPVYDAGEQTLVVTVTDANEAARIEALLEDNGVPAVKQTEANENGGEEEISLFVYEYFLKSALLILQQDDANMLSSDNDLEEDEMTDGEITDEADDNHPDTDDEIDEYVNQGKNLGFAVIVILVVAAVLVGWLYVKYLKP